MAEGVMRGVSDALERSDGYKAMFAHVEKRLTSLELTLAAVETELAVNDEKRKAVQARFQIEEKRLEKIEGHISRLVWLIVTALMGAMISFLLHGGKFF